MLTISCDLLSLALLLFRSFVTMTGYNNTNPHTQLETIFSIVVTMVGISLFATIIGTVGSLVTNLDSSALYFRSPAHCLRFFVVDTFRGASELLIRIDTCCKHTLSKI